MSNLSITNFIFLEISFFHIFWKFNFHSFKSGVNAKEMLERSAITSGILIERWLCCYLVCVVLVLICWSLCTIFRRTVNCLVAVAVVMFVAPGCSAPCTHCDRKVKRQLARFLFVQVSLTPCRWLVRLFYFVLSLYPLSLILFHSLLSRVTSWFGSYQINQFRHSNSFHQHKRAKLL